MPSPALELHVVSAPGDATAFLPDAISAPPGTLVRVTFSNASNQAHNLTFGTPIAAGTKTIVDAGQSDAATFTTPAPGTYEFVCTIHMGMSGTLVVS